MGAKPGLGHRVTRLGLILLIMQLGGCGGPELKPWHTFDLDGEFEADEFRLDLDGYRALEDRLFTQLEGSFYAKQGANCPETGSRYCAGSAADPRDAPENWNRTLEIASAKPLGSVLLLHGMSDSPYSLRHFATALAEDGFHVLALRYPGHGTLPSGLRDLSAEDLTAAVRIGARHLERRAEGLPLHIIGYSTGATLAVDYALDAAASESMQAPASLVLISPAVRVHSAAALARFKNMLSVLPGAGGIAWLSVMPENDPYKYNSFATNAAAVVHELTRTTDRRVRSLSKEQRAAIPPILVIKSAVDSTVDTDAVVDNLLAPLNNAGNELILFDINHAAAARGQLAVDQDRFTQRLNATETLNFRFTLVTNTDPAARSVEARTRIAGRPDFDSARRLNSTWPADTLSLSHIALPFPPDDPVYGSTPPDDEGPWLGNLSLRGERGVSALPPEFLLRMRYNPFFGYTLQRTRDWLQAAQTPEEKKHHVQ